jgi:ribosomal protein S18 acetylase RimI-like enzyme
MIFTIRQTEARDESRWRDLWAGYCRFYEREPQEEITQYTWSRILDRDSPIHSIVAESGEQGVIGMANYLLHENTSTLRPACYLQDLYVDPTSRAAGAGKALIDWLVSEMHAQRWARLYWSTRENNYRARALYDKYTPHSGFLRYVLINKEI